MFKECPKCNHVWDSREDFLKDSDLKIIGYQVNFHNLELGHILFNHNCGTTLAISAGNFTDLYDGPIYRVRLTGTEECPGYCLQKHQTKRCPSVCECAYIREVMQIIKKYPKNKSPE